jgi:hypothetical protein
MTTIWKHKLFPGDATVLMITGHVLSAGVQGDDIFVWATHYEDTPTHQVTVYASGTGHPCTHVAWTRFVNTVFLDNLGLVFHIFVEEP